MNIIVQIITSVIGSLGFAVIYNVRGVKLFVSGIGGGISWAVYLLAVNCGASSPAGVLMSTLLTGFISELFARILKTPVTILFVPMLIPLIPGRSLFYATAGVVQGDYTEFCLFGQRLLLEAGAIALGIILITCGAAMILKIYRTFVCKTGLDVL